MQPVLSETFFLSAGDADAEKELSLQTLASKIIEIATRHANHLNIGNPQMEDIHAGWVISRLTIEMISSPELDSYYEISTWIESFNRHFSSRCFQIASNGKIIGYVRTIWMIIDTVDHKNIGLSHFNLDSQLISGESVPISLQGKHPVILTKDSEQDNHKNALITTDPVVYHTFQYADLDGYRHVNTVKYIALILNQFNLDYYDKNKIVRFELAFQNEARYGRLCRLLRYDDPQSQSSSFQLEDNEENRLLLSARLFFKPRD